MRDAFIARLTEIAEHDPRIMLVTGDLGFGVLTDYTQRFPKQFLNAGVAEQNMTGLAVGMAQEGRVVFTYSIANFPVLRCLEQIRNDAAYHEVNVNVVSVGGGFSYGALGMSHHATEDLAVMRAIPNVTVLSPGCLWEVQEATSACVQTPGVCYLRLDKSHAGRTNRDGEKYELGKARVLRQGRDAALIATGGILGEVLNAADELEKTGLSCTVVSVSCLKPFDADTVLQAAAEARAAITIEEHVVEGGLAGAFCEACVEQGIFPRKFARVGLRSGFSSVVGSQAYLRARYRIDASAIISKLHCLLAGQ